MIQNVRDTSPQLKVRPADRLRVHFVALARRVMAWKTENTEVGYSGASIGVTSVDERVGRTVVAFNLAAALASVNNGSVLLVETRFSANGFSKKAPGNGNGFSEVLDGSESPAECICKTNIENLFVMSAGKRRGDSMLELPVEGLASLHAEMGNSFDYIVYDLPAAGETSLCYPIMQSLDGVLIANQPNIQESKLKRIVKRIRETGTDIIGLVLNKA